jgi:F420H(2)-dependent quinone reductase
MKLPQGNGLVLAVLRSRVHWLLSGMVVELRYTGRRTAREYVLPVQYAADGERLVVRPQAVKCSNWWRNFHTPTPVTVRLAGQIRRGTAHLVTVPEPAWEQARRSYTSRWRRPARRMSGPFVVISMDQLSAPPNAGADCTGLQQPEKNNASTSPSVVFIHERLEIQ